MSSPSTTVPEQDDTPIPPSLILFIHSLPDTLSNYSRFLGNLRIPVSAQPQFFADLRSFREQPSIIRLLTSHPAAIPGTPELSNIYRETTRKFLASRFAHPWCRGPEGKVKEGWLKAEWGNVKKQDEGMKREEERLHRLLVVLWVPFRRRMMVGEEELSVWMEEEREREKVREEERAARRAALADSAVELGSKETVGDGKATKDSSSKSTHPAQPPPPYDSNDDDDEDDGIPRQPQGANAQAAAGLFVGAAVTSFLANNKRARKYLYKKLNKGR